MSVWAAGGVAAAYVAGVVGLHRLGVARRVRRAEGFPTVRWIDWDTLLEGITPSGSAPITPSGAEGPLPSPVLAAPRPPEGGPPPRVLDTLDPADLRRATLLRGLVSGAPVDPAAFLETDFGGGGARWLALLAWLRSRPLDVLQRLEQSEPTTLAEAYLREHLALTLDATPVNLEWLAFAVKRRVAAALKRFGERPALYLVRAHASSLLGLEAAVLDDLARAVYFSREAPFYLGTITAWSAAADLRPALARACREASRRLELSEEGASGGNKLVIDVKSG